MVEMIVKTLKFPEQVHVEIKDNTVTMKGPKGVLKREFKTHRVILTQ